MLCKKCENNVKSDFKYCPYCGERIISDFHDQFHDLTPPFAIHDLAEDDNAAQFYVAAPHERQPDFDISGFEDMDGVQEDTPYFVYRPEVSPTISRSRTIDPEPVKVREKPVHHEQQEKGVGMGKKLLIIALTLLLAAAVTIVGYQFLRAEVPFQNVDLSAMFASVYVM